MVASSDYFSSSDVFYGTPGGKWKELYSDLPEPAGLLIADPRTPATLYAASVWWGGSPAPLPGAASVVEGRKLGRLFKSVDGGVNWSVLRTGLPVEGISDLAMHPSNSKILYAAGHTGVFKSIDAGASWDRTSEGLVDVRSIRLIIDPARPETLFLGTDYGVFRSTDGAATWQPMNQGLAGCGSVASGDGSRGGAQ
jgi:hypothetical protein